MFRSPPQPIWDLIDTQSKMINRLNLPIMIPSIQSGNLFWYCVTSGLFQRWCSICSLTSLFCWNSGSSCCTGYTRELGQGTHIPSIYQHQKDFSKYCSKSSCKGLWTWFGRSPSSTKGLGEACRELYVHSFLPKLSVKLPRFPQFCLPFFVDHLSVSFDGMRSIIHIVL